MSRNRTETWLALIVVGIGLIPVAIVGLWAYMSATATPLHPNVKIAQAYLRIHHAEGDGARIDYGPVKITRSRPGTRAYGAAGEAADAERKVKDAHHV